MNSTTMKFRTLGARVAPYAMVLAGSMVLGSCAEKGYSPLAGSRSPKISLQITTIGNQAVSPTSPRFVVAVAGFDTGDNGGNSGNSGNGGNGGNDGGGLLGFAVAPYSPGTQTVTLNVDISPCLAAFADLGKQTCTLLVGAALKTDTAGIGNGDPFKGALWDFSFQAFEAAPGRPVTVAPIDLSASRFSFHDLVDDEALRLGGAQTPTNWPANQFNGQLGMPIFGIAGGAGSPPTLFAAPAGQDFATSPNNSSTVQVFPQLAIFSGGIWRKVIASAAPATIFNNGGAGGAVFPFGDLTAFSASEVYLAHISGLYKYDGTNIVKVPTVTDSVFSVASATSGTSKLVIAGVQSGGVWIGNGTTFSKSSIPTTARTDQVCINSANEAFAASTQSSNVYRFDGTTWTLVPVQGTGSKLDLQCAGQGQAFLISQNSNFFKWNGSGWTQLPNTGLPTFRSWRMGVVSANEIYAVGDSNSVDRAFVRFDGTAWTQVGRTRSTQRAGRMWATAGAGFVLSNQFARVERVTSAGVSVVSISPAFKDVVMTSPSNAFIVGQNYFLGRWDGSKWNVDAPPAGTQTFRMLQGVWSDRSTNAWAVGVGSVIAQFNGTSWSTVSDSLRPIATQDNYNAVWGFGTDVWIAGNSTMVHCKALACFTESTAGSGPLYSIWGTSASNVYAVGKGGRILQFNGSTWSPMGSVPTGRTLLRIAGSSPTDIWAVGDSALLHFDGTAWTNYKRSTVGLDDGDKIVQQNDPNFGARINQGNFQMGLWVASPKEAYVGLPSGNVFRWNGSGWQQATPDNSWLRSVVGISGSAGGCALVVRDGSGDNPGAILSRGVGPTGCFATPFPQVTSWP